MKKKIFAVMLCAVMCISLAACGNSVQTTASGADHSNGNDETVMGNAESEAEESASDPMEESTSEPVEESASEPAEESMTEPAMESATGSTVNLTAESALESTPEELAVPEPEPTYTYADMNMAMYAKQAVNVRELPSTDGERVGGLSTNQEVTVTGQCNETGWYRIEYDGGIAYVSNHYLSDTKVEVAAAEAVQETAASSSSASTVPKASDYPVGEWVDMGGWSFIVTNDWMRPSGVKGFGFHLNDGSAKWCWLNYDSASMDAVYQFNAANCCHCTEVTHGGTKPLWDNERGVYYFP